GLCVYHGHIYSHRLGDVLELPLAEKLPELLKFAAHLVVDFAGDADATGLGDPLKPGRNVDAVAGDTGLGVSHVAEVEPDPGLHGACGLDPGIGFGHNPLDGERALDCVHDALELSQDAIAGGVDDAPAALSDHWEEDGLVSFQIANGGFLVSAHERAIASDIGSEDRCQFAGSV